MNYKRQIINPLSSALAASLLSFGIAFPVQAFGAESPAKNQGEKHAASAHKVQAAPTASGASSDSERKSPKKSPENERTADSAKGIEVDVEKLERVPEGVKRKPIYAYANFFYILLLQGRIDFLKKISQRPFYFEDRIAANDADFELEMDRIISSQRLSGLKIKRYQLFSAKEMENAFGARPERLANWPVTEDAYFSIAEIGDSAIVVLWLPGTEEGFYTAAAIHD